MYLLIPFFVVLLSWRTFASPRLMKILKLTQTTPTKWRNCIH